MKDQLFPIFDAITSNFLFYKSREQVHVDGDWHKGIQANIVRKNNKDTFDILVQVRSDIVDIAKGKYDQSLAVQMLIEDNLDEEKCLQRGLITELGISSYKISKIETNLRIIKTYSEDLKKLNRELLSLFIVSLENDEELSCVSPKVKDIFWLEWSEFLDFFNANKVNFTKTSQFYFGVNDLVRHIEIRSLKHLNISPRKYKSNNYNDKLFFYIHKANGNSNLNIINSNDKKSLNKYFK